MRFKQLLTVCMMGTLLLTQASCAGAAAPLELGGYTDDSGAITVLHGGDSADPYFAMQALLLAHENGMDISVPAEKFANWLVPRQKPDGTFDRFCRGADKTWVSCKTADADDSLLAIWMKLLETMPAKLAGNPVWRKSHEVSKVALEHLYQPSRGIYMVSPVVLHGLFMDNLEVWSLKVHLKQPQQRAASDKLARAIHDTFWDPVNKRFLVSTQLEQRSQKQAFYPDHVAQIFPLMFDFPLLPVNSRPYYRDWMAAHRAEWLIQGQADYPWGLLAVLALRQNDKVSAGCWLRESTPLRHSKRWSVSDEASYQILLSRGVVAVDKQTSCK
ncbi:hypothetical protein [Polaromonas sp.]|uniref:hypothetical protein n=1 Tax=Polaromonas sp. TaxID=1869339 RepID=UPI002489EFFB|nr:hypothetical protein [Polaromonas sp.]MDI1272149.1 hypothetical protein [Polaromonas sp.]